MDNNNKILSILLAETESDDSDLSAIAMSSTSSSSESDTDFRGKRAKIENYLHVIEKYTDRQFKEHFRLCRLPVEKLIEEYKTYYLTRERNCGRKMMGAECEIYITLWFLANTSTYRQIGDRFDVTKSSVIRILHRVINWLVLNSNKYIKWPSEEDMKINENKFLNKKNFPKVIGAIDGSHIKINAPKKYKQSYYNRKKYYSILIQAIVDADKKFIDVYCGEPGAMHDARLFRRSTFFKKISENHTLIPLNKILLGDSAYPENNYIVTPFKDFGNLSRKQKNFNYIHSATRIVVENAFGLLKRRFRRLTFFESSDLAFVVNCVVATCALHNYCIMENDNEEWLENNSDYSDDSSSTSEESDNEYEPQITQQNANKRLEIFNILDSLHLLN